MSSLSLCACPPGKETAFFEITNSTDLTVFLVNDSPENNSPEKIKLLPRSSAIAQCRLIDGKAVLPYEVTNWHTGKTENLRVELKVN